jgi:hypothetical protein
MIDATKVKEEGQGEQKWRSSASNSIDEGLSMSKVDFGIEWKQTRMTVVTFDSNTVLVV